MSCLSFRMTTTMTATTVTMATTTSTSRIPHNSGIHRTHLLQSHHIIPYSPGMDACSNDRPQTPHHHRNSLQQHSRACQNRCDSTGPVCTGNNYVQRSNNCQYDTIPERRGPDKHPGTRQRSCKKTTLQPSISPSQNKPLSSVSLLSSHFKSSHQSLHSLSPNRLITNSQRRSQRRCQTSETTFRPSNTPFSSSLSQTSRLVFSHPCFQDSCLSKGLQSSTL
jgi:hypothetical protein